MGNAASSLASGAVFGRYVLVETIGRGAMGEVWVAIDPDLDRKVALKLLRADRIGRPEDRARLDTEARLMARLTHPHVVTIHDVGSLDDQVFIAMEFVDGEALDRWIARGPHPCAEVLTIMRQAAAGLAAAHGVGLVHRDFKPANVMIGRDGRVRVLDFGLARPEGSVARPEGEAPPRSGTLDSDDASRSDGGTRIQGSPAYMSAEQHRGAAVDARSDLFSFCVVLFEALYGVRPFRGGTRLAVALAVVEGRLTEPPADLRARVPEWIHAIVRRGLAGDPDQRFADMDELIAALERSPEQRRRRKLQVAGASLAALGLLGLALALRPEPAPDPCIAAARDEIAEVWSAELSERLRERIDGVAGARELAGQRLIEGVDRQVDAWRDARVQVCRDDRARRSTERLQATREACLDDRRAGVAALVRLAEDERNSSFVEAVAARPFAAARALGDASRCVDRAPPSEASELPSASQRDARAELALALALGQEPLSTELGGDEGDPELALLLARVAAGRREYADAEAQLHAVAAAATSDDPELAGQAWLALIELELARLDAGGEPADLGMRERAAELILYADALLPADDRVARAELGLLAGRLALHHDLVETPSLLEAGIDRLDREPLREPDLLIALLEQRARVHERRGQVDQAASARETAEQLGITAFGSR